MYGKFYKGVIGLSVFEYDELEMVKGFLNNYEKDGIRFKYSTFLGEHYEINNCLIDSDWFDQFKKDFLDATGIKLHSDIKDRVRREEPNPEAPLGYYAYDDYTWYVKGIDIRVEPGSVLIDYPEYCEQFITEEQAINYRNDYKGNVYTVADYNENHFSDLDDGYGYYEWYSDENYMEDNSIGWSPEDISNAPIRRVIVKVFGNYELRYVVVFPEPHKLDRCSVIDEEVSKLDLEIEWKQQELNELLSKRESFLMEKERLLKEDK